MSDPETIRRLHVKLSLADGVGPILFMRLLEHFGDIERIFSTGPAKLRDVAGVGDKTAGAILEADTDAVDCELALAAEYGAEVLRQFTSQVQRFVARRLPLESGS